MTVVAAGASTGDALCNFERLSDNWSWFGAVAPSCTCILEGQGWIWVCIVSRPLCEVELVCFALGGLCSDSFVLLAWTASSRPFRALLASPSHSWERVVRASGSTKIALLYKNWSIWHLCVCGILCLWSEWLQWEKGELLYHKFMREIYNYAIVKCRLHKFLSHHAVQCIKC